MKFYVTNNAVGETTGCYLTKREAVDFVKSDGGGSVDCVQASVNAETVRRLLGGIGGYADSMNCVFDSDAK